MTIKTRRTFNDDMQRKLEYPCMGKFSDGTIIIATSPTVGTIIYSNSQEMIGLHLCDFEFTSWKPYFGAVTIEWED